MLDRFKMSFLKGLLQRSAGAPGLRLEWGEAMHHGVSDSDIEYRVADLGRGFS